jgi:hypothetical protein
MTHDSRLRGIGWLRGAAVVWILTGSAHTLGTIAGKVKGPEPELRPIVEQMHAFKVGAGIFETTFGNFYDTFSSLTSLFFFSVGFTALLALRWIGDPRGLVKLADLQIVHAVATIVVCVAFVAVPPILFCVTIVVLASVARAKLGAAARRVT